MNATTFVLRHATSRDEDRVLTFYRSNQHASNYPRADDVFRYALRQDRKLLIIEREDGQIVAATAVFDHLDGRYREVGATRVIENGYGFQRLMYSSSIVHEALMVWRAGKDRGVNAKMVRVNGGSVDGINRGIQGGGSAGLEHGGLNGESWLFPVSVSLVPYRRRGKGNGGVLESVALRSA